MLIDVDSADNSASQKNTSWISHWAKSGGPFRISTVDPLHDVARMAAENIDRRLINADGASVLLGVAKG